MVVCSNCDLTSATVQCQQCAEFCDEGASFCTDCSEFHLKIKKFRGHLFTPISSVELCSNCELNLAQHRCIDCPLSDQLYCDGCVEVHGKMKISKSHRVVSNGFNKTSLTDSVSSRSSSDARESESEGHLTKTASSSWSGISIDAAVSRGSVTRQDSDRTPAPQSFQFNASDSMKNLHDRYREYTNFSDTIEMLNFFEFSILVDSVPSSSVMISIVGILAVIIVFAGELICSAGSSLAIIVAAIAFLRFMQYRKARMNKNDPRHTQHLQPQESRRKSLVRSSSRTEKRDQFLSERVQVRIDELLINCDS